MENKKREIARISSLTPMQEGMLFHSLSAEGGVNYYQQVCFFIEGKVEMDKLRQTWDEIIQRYDVFRTLFRWKELSKPVQIVLKEHQSEFAVFDLIHLSAGEQNRYLQEFKAADLQKPFDFEEGRLNRLAICKLTEEKYFVCWTFHHMLLDGWSMPVVMANLFQIYFNLVHGLPLPAKPRVQFGDYLDWLKKQDVKAARSFWQGYMEKVMEPTLLPREGAVDRSETIKQADELHLELDSVVTRQLNAFCQAESITINALIQTAWGVLLQKYNNTGQSCSGMTVSGRPATMKHVEEIVGILINTLPVVICTGAEDTVRSMLRKVNETLVEVREYEYMPLAELQKMSSVGAGNELFDSLIVFENYPIGSALTELDLGLKIVFDGMFELTNYDLTIAVTAGETLQLDFLYNPQRLPAVTMQRIQRNFQQVILNMLASPECTIASLKILSPEERKTLLEVFNRRGGGVPEQTLSQLFEEQAASSPGAIALICGDQQWTYAELNTRANQLARQLRRLGVRPGQIVGIMAYRSLEMIASLLGILKAGGAYLPIDPAYPEEHIRYMLTDAGVRMLLTSLGYQDDSLQIVNPAEAGLEDVEVQNLPPVNHSGDLAYVIYTSGSTGKPKGVLIEHRSIANALVWRRHEYGLGSRDRVLQLFSYSFDGFLTSFFTPIISGAAVVQPGDEDARDPGVLGKLIRLHRITHFICVPSLYAAILECLRPEDLQSLRVVTLAGEKVTARLVARSKELKATLELVNEYGPTENSVVTTIERDLQPGKPVTIGRPIANTGVYIFDRQLQLLPTGGVGELCVSGPGLARGYLQRPDLTVEKFITNPETGERMYRTGDQARWLADGRIEFVGRIDEQVKIRGYRIEPGQIEQKLLGHPAVKEGIVIAREDASGSLSLCAYFVAEGELPVGELRAELARELPVYMIPAYFVRLNSMPLTVNGKIDRRALPEPEETIILDTYLPPRTPKEEQLCQIWSQILQVQRVGIANSFFELGGDSIKAIQVVGKASGCGIYITVKDIFKYKTIGAILENVDADIQKGLATQGEVVGEVALTPIQKWFFEQKYKYNHYWNQSNLFIVKNDIDTVLLEQAFQKLLEHHDALRMEFRERDGEIVQVNRGVKEVAFHLEICDLSQYPYAVQQEQMIETGERVQNRLQLSGDCLCQAVLFDLGTQGKRLLIAVHHLIIDGVSWRIMLEDLETLYRGQLQVALPPKTTSYQEYSTRLVEYVKTRPLAVDYWEQIDLRKVPEIKTDEEPCLLKDFEQQTIELDREYTTNLLTGVHWAYGTGTPEILLAALILTLHEVLGMQSALITLEGHGREKLMEDVDLVRTVGWFTSAYPVYLAMQENPERLIRHVKETLRRVPDKGIGFGFARYMQANPLLKLLNPEIGFNYLGQFDGTLTDLDEGGLLRPASEGSGLSVHSENHSATVFDLSGYVFDGTLRIALDYHPGYFPPDTMQRFKNCYQHKLCELVEHCLSKTEKCYTPADFGLEKVLDELDLEPLLQKSGFQKIYELTPMQSGMLYHSLVDEQGNSYYEQTCFYIEGKIRLDLLKQAWQEVLTRHDIFRTEFRWKKLRAPVQVIYGQKEAEINQWDISGLSYAEQQQYIEEFKQADLARRFDFEAGRLNRLSLLKISEEQYFVCWAFHHILLDGWSGQIVLEDFFTIYHSLAAGEALPQEPQAQFTDYLDWLRGRDSWRAHSFWKEYLVGIEGPTLLAPERQNSQKPLREAQTSEWSLSAEQTRSIQHWCMNRHITVNAFVQTAWGILLQKYSRTEHSCFGMTVSGRRGEIHNVEEMVGLLINTVPVVVRAGRGMTVEALLKQVNEELVNLQEYDYISLAELQKIVKADLAEGLFDTIVVFENFPLSTVMGRMQLDFAVAFESSHELTNYALTLAVFNAETLQFKFSYNPDLFSGNLIGRIKDNFVHLMAMMLQHSADPVQELQILSPLEKARILTEWNRPVCDQESAPTVVKLFEEQARQTPDLIAVREGTQTVTYRELNVRANRLARALLARGVTKGELIALLLNSPLAMATAIFAVWKAGAAYVPVDPDYPAERIAYILGDSQVKHVLTDDGKARQGNLLEWIELQDIELDQGVADNPPDMCQGSGAAYVIYTSGSTGKPKGVVVLHSSIANSISWRRDEYRLTPDDRVLQLFSAAFDGFLTSFMTPVVSGAQVILLTPEGRKDPVVIRQAIVQYGITHFISVPSLYAAILEYLTPADAASLRMVTLAGEAVKPGLVRQSKALKHDLELINEYGPTENSVVTTCARNLQPDAVISIGKPVANTQVYLVDQNLNMVPIGYPGEICISGTGLAQGYWNRPELTAERFTPARWGDGRLYHTGDLARWLEDGTLEFLGRLDGQVKIRGHRIEVGEIEACINQLVQVRESVVIDRSDDKGNQYLAAYVVTGEDGQSEEIRRQLGSVLPAYMVPDYIIQIPELPLTPNGKIDRKALPAPGDLLRTQITYTAPTNELEERLTRVWSEVLGIKQVGIHDNFFTLGGHSLKATALAAGIYKEFDIALALNEILQYPTVDQLARVISSVQQLKQPVSRLNSEKPVRLFCFPPGAGNGIVYKGLADLLDTHAVYSFDFIEAEDRIAQYVDSLLAVQPEGPYIFLGFSGGGNIAFEVARAMLSRGCRVDSIIMLDSYLKKQVINRRPEEIELVVEQVLTVAAENPLLKEYISIETFKRQVAGRVKSSMKYMDQLVNTGQITADIYLVRADDSDEQGDEGCWTYATTGRVFRVAGSGRHDEMLEPVFLEKNAAKINEILCSLNSPKEVKNQIVSKNSSIY